MQTEPWIIGFVRRLLAIGLVGLCVIVVCWTLLSLTLATLIAVSVDGWSVGGRVGLGLVIFVALDIAGGLVLLFIATVGRAIYWLFTGRWLALR
jgi:hypothetical protein